MKVITLLLSLLFFSNISNAQDKHDEKLQGQRIEKTINSGWTFNYFPSEAADKGYELPGFNDSRWPAISIPHTWNSYETTRELKPFAKSPGETGETFWWTGWGWYRKHFSINTDLTNRKLFIEFEGVQKYCKVWINGKYAGDHKGGSGSFDFDITALVNTAGDNLIAVAVSYLQKDEFRMHPVSDGKLHAFCGIYRNVRLVLKNKLFIPMQGSAAHEGGTFISTTAGSAGENIVNIKTWVKNDNSQSVNCSLQTTISDSNNQIISIIKTDALINAGELYMFDQTSGPVKNPHLWSVEDPYLYSISSEVLEKKEVVDLCASSFGFRWFRKEEKAKAVYLNDKRVELSGINRSQEYPWLGGAIPDWLTETDCSDIKGRGYNFIRAESYPLDETACKAADKSGVLIEQDFSAITHNCFSAEEQKMQIREIVRRDRNHPSVISWRTGNYPDDIALAEVMRIEGNAMQITPLPALIDSTVCYPDPIKHIGDPAENSFKAGEPAKIIVRNLHKSLPADRGSVTLLIADIIDSKGNHLSDATNCLRWKVTGPARVVGPACYISYADSGRNVGEGWYLEMPVANILRSTGKAGKITITVFSSGLSSGSCEIDAEDLKTDVSFLTEPELADAGRKPVMGTALVTSRIEDIPVEILPAAADITLTAPDKNGYSVIIEDIIQRNNPAADTLSIEYKAITELFARQLYNNGGMLSAADYNFNAAHFNNCRLISGYIDRTKLPVLFKESLKKYYAELIIGKGIEKNAGEEMNWLNWIPSGGVVVIVPDEPVSQALKGVVYAKQTGLSDIIRVIYPQFAKFSEDAKERALIFISKMNPSVNSDYTARMGEPILIPEYKFISE